MIREGTADILFSFEENETYRTLKFLKRGGLCFANLERSDRFDEKIRRHLEENETAFRSFDAGGMAMKIGSVMSTNIVLIGYAVGTGLVPFNYKEMKSVLESLSREKHLETNLKAFEAGFQGAKT
jgi:indolepyruvate ferredoxin oxidoreductase beta subunit